MCMLWLVVVGVTLILMVGNGMMMMMMTMMTMMTVTLEL